MATVLAMYNSDGCIGRCDAKCHDAQQPACDCICGGANHGCGHRQAVANTQELFERLVEQMGDNGTRVEVPAQQLELM